MASTILFCIALLPGAVSSVDSSGNPRYISWQSYLNEAELFFKERVPEAKVKKFVLPIDGSVEERGMYIRSAFESWSECRNRPILVFAHSQGGIDTRYAIRTLGLKSIRSLITVGTPHRGSEIGTWAVHQAEKLSFRYYLLKWLGGYDLKAIPFARQLSPEFLQKHERAFASESEVDSGHVLAGCAGECSLPFRLIKWFTGVSSGWEGDGMVPLASQAWGQELARVTLDHLGEISENPDGAPERKRMHEAVLGHWRKQSFFIR